MPNRIKDLPPTTPLDYQASTRRHRPKIIGFVGWITAGIGYLSFVLKGAQLPSYFFPEWVKSAINPAWTPPPYSRGQFAIAVSILLAELLLALVAVAGGLGSLKLREWGRRLLIAYGVAAILLTLVKSAWQISMFDFMLDYQISTTTQPVNRASMENPQFFALILSSIVQLFWPIFVIIIATRRYVRDAFDAARLGGGSSDGWQSPKV